MHLEDAGGKPGWSEDCSYWFILWHLIIIKLTQADFNKASLWDSTVNMMVYWYITYNHETIMLIWLLSWLTENVNFPIKVVCFHFSDLIKISSFWIIFYILLILRKVYSFFPAFSFSKKGDFSTNLTKHSTGSWHFPLMNSLIPINPRLRNKCVLRVIPISLCSPYWQGCDEDKMWWQM